MSGKESACSAGDEGSIPRLGRSPGEGLGNPVQYSCLKNSMDREACGLWQPWGHQESDTTEQLVLMLSRSKDDSSHTISDIDFCPAFSIT